AAPVQFTCKLKMMEYAKDSLYDLHEVGSMVSKREEGLQRTGIRGRNGQSFKGGLQLYIICVIGH
ncbi:MAG TPA: hypothetical protein VIX90_13390, partial [Edaphobacter sp.]